MNAVDISYLSFQVQFIIYIYKSYIYIYINPWHVTITCLHKAYYFGHTHHVHLLVCYHICSRVGICVFRNYRIPLGTPGILYFHYPFLYCHPLTSILFVCDTNTSYVITYATENIQTKLPAFFLKTTKIMACNARICSYPT